MNLIHNPQQSFTFSNANLAPAVLNFPSRKRTNSKRKNGWICNLSQQYVFSQQHHEYLQVKPSANISQFTLLCRLLEADTCRVIYFDDQLTPQQLVELRKRQALSQTELLHAKVAFMFSAQVSTLYA